MKILCRFSLALLLVFFSANHLFAQLRIETGIIDVKALLRKGIVLKHDTTIANLCYHKVQFGMHHQVTLR